ncbi:hypothetical protein RHMOL_Rhmol04G0337900 [Rhododendron molle]|uniref:Uncharacterized protein n=1 Tax=Rhododendron molle TaxID=49168 RepID=A0ACC0P8P7_RHOML|nr:hypothetical protein RHMOL_Rhmol04G0337900 [Rhododendron molle]
MRIVAGLPQSTSEGTLKTTFSHFGEVSRVKILTNKKNKQPLGFAYLWFSGKESAQMAVKEMNGKVLAYFLNDFCSDPSSVATLWSFQYCIRRS